MALRKHSFNFTDFTNSKHTRKHCRATIARVVRETAEFSFRNGGAGRSTTKTHIMHRGVRKLVEEALGDNLDPFYSLVEFYSEVLGTKSGAVTRSGNNFKKAMDRNFSADLSIRPQSGVGPAFVFDAKAPLKSIMRNTHNAANNLLGEIVSFFGTAENSDNYLVLFNFLPRKTFKLESGKLTNETVNHADISNGNGFLHDDFRSSLSKKAYNNTIVVNLYYDWSENVDLSKFSSCEDFAEYLSECDDEGVDVASIQVEGMVRLVTLIKHSYGI